MSATSQKEQVPEGALYVPGFYILDPAARRYRAVLEEAKKLVPEQQFDMPRLLRLNNEEALLKLELLILPHLRRIAAEREALRRIAADPQSSALTPKGKSPKSKSAKGPQKMGGR